MKRIKYLDYNLIRLLSTLSLENFFNSPPPTPEWTDECPESPDLTDAEWEWMKKEFYRQDVVILVDGRSIDFSLPSWIMLETNGVRIPYDEYLDIQRNSIQNERFYFTKAFYEAMMLQCKGTISKFSKNGKHVLFEKIDVWGFFEDGESFIGKEGHVWMDASAFQCFNAGDAVSFGAEPYQYLKTGNTKHILFGIRNPSSVKKIDGYELPSDEGLRLQEADEYICNELCMYKKQCYGVCCLANEGLVEPIRKTYLENCSIVI